METAAAEVSSSEFDCCWSESSLVGVIALIGAVVVAVSGVFGVGVCAKWPLLVEDSSVVRVWERVVRVFIVIYHRVNEYENRVSVGRESWLRKLEG